MRRGEEVPGPAAAAAEVLCVEVLAAVALELTPQQCQDIDNWLRKLRPQIKRCFNRRWEELLRRRGTSNDTIPGKTSQNANRLRSSRLLRRETWWHLTMPDLVKCWRSTARAVATSSAVRTVSPTGNGLRGLTLCHGRIVRGDVLETHQQTTALENAATHWSMGGCGTDQDQNSCDFIWMEHTCRAPCLK